MTPTHRSSRLLGPVVLSACLLAGLAAETVLRPRPAQAEPYHAAVRALAEQAPLQIGTWVGTERDVPAAAFDLLHPNVILSREYVDSETKRSVGFLLVHCKDARDIDGHYPPVCYPAHGAKLHSSTPGDWVVDGTAIEGTEYEFVDPKPEYPDTLVQNFIITPGRYCRDMKAVSERAGDYTQRFYGAAQVQLVFRDPSRWSHAEREEVFLTIIRAYLPLFEQIRKGNPS